MADVRKKPNIFKMITKPVEQFTLLKRKPEFVFGALVIFVLTFIIQLLTTFFRPDVINNIGHGTEWVVTIVTSLVFTMFSAAIAIIARPVVLWIIISIIEPGEDFSYPISIAIYTMIITVIGSIVSFIVALIIGQNPEILYTSLGAIVAHGLNTQEFINDPVYAMLSSIDIFKVWMLVLVFIGVRIIYDISVVKALVITILYAILPTIGNVVLASLM